MIDRHEFRFGFAWVAAAILILGYGPILSPEFRPDIGRPGPIGASGASGADCTDCRQGLLYKQYQDWTSEFCPGACSLTKIFVSRLVCPVNREDSNHSIDLMYPPLVSSQLGSGYMGSGALVSRGFRSYSITNACYCVSQAFLYRTSPSGPCGSGWGTGPGSGCFGQRVDDAMGLSRPVGWTASERFVMRRMGALERQTPTS